MSRLVLVTGANGFVGRAVCAELARQGHRVRAVVRDITRSDGLPGEPLVIDKPFAHADWSGALDGVDAVVHLAARVHVMQETAADPLTEFRAANVEGTRALANAAARFGVRRFVFVSSIKVNGEGTPPGRPYRPDDPPRPQDAYGISKWEAESALHEIARDSDLEISIVRPPLVYGPGVGGNFLRLLKLVRRGIPLPLGAVDNRRSLIYNGNLASVLLACVAHPAAAGRTFLASDGDDMSTAQLVRRIGECLATHARLVPVPVSVLRLAGALTGRAAEVDRLVGSLVVDSSSLRTALGWSPPFDVHQGLRETAAWFAQSRAARSV